jgi:hypothetical protein
MFNNISWSSYWSVLIVLVILYYIQIGWAYYRREIFRPFPGNKPVKTATSSSSELSADDQIFPVVQSFTHEVTAYLEQASQGKSVKNELIYGLRQIARKYPGIQHCSYRSALDQLIEFESKDKCAVALSEEEISQVWLV